MLVQRELTRRYGFVLGVVFLVVVSFLGADAKAQKEASTADGYLGVMIQDANGAVVRALGGHPRRGVLVRAVAPGGPAERAGLRPGDMITALAGMPVEDCAQATRLMRAFHPGDSLSITGVRAGKPFVFSLIATPKPPARSVVDDAVASIPALGLTVAALSEKMRNLFAVRWEITGVVVTMPAKRDGADGGKKRAVLMRGDVIRQVNQIDVWRPDQVVDLYRRARAAGRKELLLLVEGRGGAHFVLLPLPPRGREGKGDIGAGAAREEAQQDGARLGDRKKAPEPKESEPKESEPKDVGPMTLPPLFSAPQ